MGSSCQERTMWRSSGHCSHRRESRPPPEPSAARATNGGPRSHVLTSSRPPTSAGDGTIPRLSATPHTPSTSDLRRRVVRDHRPNPRPANHRLRAQHPRAAPADSAIRVRALAEAEGNGHHPTGRWIDPPSGGTLVRSYRHRPKRAQDQTLSRTDSMRRSRIRTGRFALCVDNGDYPASLETRKLYEVLPDADAVSRGLLRVVDESGEDYLYPARHFRLVTLPPSLDRVLRGRKGRLATARHQSTRPAAIRPG
jgi:hypothetical protein